MAANYVYNGDNLRVQKIANGNLTNYLYDGLQVLAETNGGGYATKLYNPGISVTDVATGTKLYYLHDGHGNTANMIDKDGNIVQSYQYDAFGALTAGGQDKFNGYQYVGEVDVFTDTDAGLQYMQNRWYDPQLGRFISRDPSGFKGGLNLYQYAENNPLTYTDPTGLLINATLSGGAVLGGYVSLTLNNNGSFNDLSVGGGFGLGAGLSVTYGGALGDYGGGGVTVGVNGGNGIVGATGSYSQSDAGLGASLNGGVGYGIGLGVFATFDVSLSVLADMIKDLAKQLDEDKSGCGK